MEGGGATGMTARGFERPAAPAAGRVRDAPGALEGRCLACGRYRGLDDMIGHTRRHMHAAPGGGADRSALLLFTGGRLAAGGAWILAQVWDRATLADLAEFVEREWFRRRVGACAAITGPAGGAGGATGALYSMTTSVADLFAKVPWLELETDTEYRFLVTYVGEAPRPAAAGVASVMAETFIVPVIPFEAMDGRRPPATQTIPPTPACGEGGGSEPGRPPGRPPGRAPERSVPDLARPGGGGPFRAGHGHGAYRIAPAHTRRPGVDPFHAGPGPLARPTAPCGRRSP